ncbi:hypothetical protein GQ44DRAFT_71077 [Phaeosphaeriaceae sp. PMI808]|nr:hypothetical protein GQ44DRAFT_71077 [Phaeosphaeriaceae sp. PMI808]
MISIGGFRGSQATGRVHTLPAAQGLSRRGKSGLDGKDHFTLELGEERRLKQLVDTWNELAHRSTTMPEDLHVIIANLLDFNADQIMKIPTREERMRAMIFSFKLLPISLFWNTGPRWPVSQVTSGECNHWIPVEPSKCELTVTPVMEVTEEWLMLGSNNVHSERALVLRVNEINLISPSKFTIADPKTSTLYDVIIKGTEGEIILLGDSFASGLDVCYLVAETCLPLASNSPTRAALFHQYQYSDNDNDANASLRLVYRCPVELHHVKPGLDRPAHVAKLVTLPSNTCIAIKYDPISYFIPYPRRPFRGATLQGLVPMMMLGAIMGTASFGCLVAFITGVYRNLDWWLDGLLCMGWIYHTSHLSHDIRVV